MMNDAEAQIESAATVHALRTPSLPRSRRLLSMVVDHLLMGSLAFVLACLGVFLPSILNSFLSSGDSVPLSFSVRELVGPFWYLGVPGFAVYLCKDTFEGRSIAKRIFKLQVVLQRDKGPSDPVRCFLRNLFYVVWPLEVVACLVKPERRVGDYVAGTKVVPFVATVPAKKQRIASILQAFCLACLFCALALVCWRLLGPWS